MIGSLQEVAKRLEELEGQVRSGDYDQSVWNCADLAKDLEQASLIGPRNDEGSGSWAVDPDRRVLLKILLYVCPARFAIELRRPTKALTLIQKAWNVATGTKPAASKGE